MQVLTNDIEVILNESIYDAVNIRVLYKGNLLLVVYLYEIDIKNKFKAKIVTYSSDIELPGVMSLNNREYLFYRLKKVNDVLNTWD